MLVYRAFSMVGGLRLTRADAIHQSMKWTIPLAALMLAPAAAEAQPRAPLQDAVALNIGLNCQWQQGCMTKQQRAMKKALKYVQKYRPAAWRVQLCNRNAGRKRYRVDWVGFDNCIRNAALRPLPPRPLKRRSRPVS
jgi:hypothetical protein